MNLNDTLVQAIREHWKAHDTAYPQKIALSAQQHADLMAVRAVAAKGNASSRPFETESFLGCLWGLTTPRLGGSSASMGW